MSTRFVGSSLCLLLAACATSRQEHDTTPGSVENRLGLTLGRRALTASTYGDVSDQGTLALTYSRQRDDSLLGWETGFAVSGAEDDTASPRLEGRTAELFGGARTTFGRGAWRPFVGFGATLIRSELETNGVSDNGGSLGGYVHGGVAWDFAEHVGLEFDLRQVFATNIVFDTSETDADYGQFGLSLVARF